MDLLISTGKAGISINAYTRCYFLTNDDCRDNEITKGPELSMDDWTDINMTDNFQLPIGGNVIYPGGTDTLPNSLGGMDFDPALLESVDYPINQLTSWSPPEAMNGNGQAQQGAFT